MNIPKLSSAFSPLFKLSKCLIIPLKEFLFLNKGIQWLPHTNQQWLDSVFFIWGNCSRFRGPENAEKFSWDRGRRALGTITLNTIQQGGMGPRSGVSWLLDQCSLHTIFYCLPHDHCHPWGFQHDPSHRTISQLLTLLDSLMLSILHHLLSLGKPGESRSQTRLLQDPIIGLWV